MIDFLCRWIICTIYDQYFSIYTHGYIWMTRRWFLKKFMPIIYVIAFVIGIIFIVTADTGLITSYYPALIAGIIISCFAGVFLAIYLYAWHKQSKWKRHYIWLREGHFTSLKMGKVTFLYYLLFKGNHVLETIIIV